MSSTASEAQTPSKRTNTAGEAPFLPASPLGDTRAGDPKEKNSGSVEINHDDIKHDFWMKYFAKPKSSRQKAHASKSSQISESSHHLRRLWIQV